MRSHRGRFWAPVVLLSATASVLSGFAVQAQTAGTPQSIEQKISAQYTPTKATADHSDIVTSGAVIVLKKDGLVMSSTTSGAAAANVYKDGRITSSGAWKMTRGSRLSGIGPGRRQERERGRGRLKEAAGLRLSA